MDSHLSTYNLIGLYNCCDIKFTLLPAIPYSFCSIFIALCVPTVVKLSIFRIGFGINLANTVYKIPESVMAPKYKDIEKKIADKSLQIFKFENKSDVWKIFSRIQNVCSGIIQPYVICDKCHKLFKHPLTASTSNLKKHPCYIKVYGCNEDPVTPTATTSSADDTVANAEAPLPKKQVQSENIKSAILDACVNFCVKDLRPFNTIQGEGFLELAECFIQSGVKLRSNKVDIQDLVPHPTTVSRNVQKLYDEKLAQVVKILKPFIEKGNVAATTDMWTQEAQKRSFITVTVHFIDAEWILKSYALFTIEFPNFDQDDKLQTKSGENIMKEIIEKFACMGIEECAVRKIHFVTDRGSNFIKAFQMYGYHRSNCAAHILNSILQNTFHKSFLQSDAPQVLKLFQSSKSLVEYMKRSAYCSQLDTTLKQETKSRWNSKQLLLNSIQKNYKQIEDILVKVNQRERLHNIPNYLLDSCMDILTPFKIASDILEGEKSPTCQQVILQFQILKSKLERIKVANMLNEITKLIDRALILLVKTFTFEEHHYIATYLWPQFRQLRIIDDPENRADILQTIERKLEVIDLSSPAATMDSVADSAVSSTSTLSNNNTSPDTYVESLMSGWVDVPTEAPTKSKFAAELEKYTNITYDGCNILSFWRQHEKDLPLLSQLARSILQIPASSAPSERTFSAAGRMLDRRFLLSSENIDALLFLRTL